MNPFARHFSRTRSGDFKVRLSDQERALLESLPSELRALMSAPTSDATRRLFPPAYASAQDAERQEDYDRLMREELVSRRLEAIETVASTLNAGRLTTEELDAWMRVLNDVRLVLGTLLDVSEEQDPLDVDPSAPDIGQRVAYVMLSSLVGDAVDALADTYP